MLPLSSDLKSIIQGIPYSAPFRPARFAFRDFNATEEVVGVLEAEGPVSRGRAGCWVSGGLAIYLSQFRDRIRI